MVSCFIYFANTAYLWLLFPKFVTNLYKRDSILWIFNTLSFLSFVSLFRMFVILDLYYSYIFIFNNLNFCWDISKAECNFLNCFFISKLTYSRSFLLSPSSLFTSIAENNLSSVSSLLFTLNLLLFSNSVILPFRKFIYFSASCIFWSPLVKSLIIYDKRSKKREKPKIELKS